MKHFNSFALIVLFSLILNLKAIGQIIHLPDTTNVLFIGNSFTKNNFGAQNAFQKIAFGAGHPAHVEGFLRDGWSVKNFVHDSDCWTMIRKRDWDYIVIQDFQSYYWDSVGHFQPEVLEDNISFQKAIKEAKPCTKIIYVAGWDQKDGNKKLFPNDDLKHSLHRIMANYKYLNNQKGVHNIIAPVSLAWLRTFEKRPDLAVSLYKYDGRHPGVSGTYLYALVMYVTIFHYNPLITEFVDGQSTVDTKFFCNTAWYAVRDTMKYTHIKDFRMRTHSIGKLLIIDPGYHHYQWYKDHVAIAGATHFYYKPDDLDGYYTVKVTTKKGCVNIAD